MSTWVTYINNTSKTFKQCYIGVISAERKSLHGDNQQLTLIMAR